METEYRDEVALLTLWGNNNNLRKSKELTEDFRNLGGTPHSPVPAWTHNAASLCGHGYTTAPDRNVIQKVVRMAEKFTVCTLPSMEEIF